jgi:hypothetical protein
LIEITARIICNGCGNYVEGKTDRSTRFAWAYGTAKQLAHAFGWLSLGCYGPHRHFCAICADKPLLLSAQKKKAPK